MTIVPTTNEQSIWANVIRHISTSSALNPTLILCGIVLPTTLTLAAFKEPPFSDYLILIAAAPVLIACCQIIGFSLFSPDRLHNEAHIENKMLIRRFGENVGSSSTEINIGRDSLVENPMIKNQREI